MTVLPHRRRLTREERRTILSVVAALLAIAVTTLVLLPFREELSVGTVALLMLPPPLLASYAGLRATLACAVVGAVAFNFFFTEPYNSPRIAADESVAAFIVYLVVAAALAVAVSASRTSSRDSRRRARTLEMLETLSEGLLRGPRLDPALRSALHELVRLVPLTGASLLVLDGDDLRVSAGDASRAEWALDRAGITADEGGPRVRSLRIEGRVRLIPVVGAAGSVGMLAADPGDTEPTEDAWAVVEGFADLAGLGVARARLDDERRRRETLEAIDRLRAALARSVTHDLRTPLAAIRTAAGALREVEDPAVRDRLLNDIDAESVRLTHLVNSMLDLSRIESGALEVRPGLVPVDELVREAVAATPGADGVATVDLPADLQPVSLDEDLIRQVIVNLLRNALTHAPGSPVEVVARVESEPQTLVVRVVDHGPGIPEAERERVFEPYRRLRASGASTGSGLGLAICRGYVEAHGGTIAAETTPGGGATMVVRIPILPS